MSDDESTLRPVSDEAGLAAVLARPDALLYTHRPTSWKAFRTLAELRRLALAHPEVPIFVLDVERRTELGGEAAHRLGIPDEHPRLMLLRSGSVMWETTHRSVRFEDLEEVLEELVEGVTS